MVIIVFEKVYIEHEHGDGLLVACGPEPFLFQGLVKASAVCDTGETVN